MITDGPLVSVVMPNYNTPEEYLRKAIESVLGQTYKNIEYIIVDDASTGSDTEIIRSYDDKRIVLLQNESNRHVSFSLNRGFGAARGEYIARIDSDDICLPRRIEKQVRFLQRKSSIDVLCSRAEFFGDRKGVFSTGIRDPEHMKTAVFFGSPIIHPSVMFRASFIREHAMLYSTDPDYKAAEDYELWSRCAFAGRIFEYPKVLLKYRMHARQVSTAARKLQDDNANHVRRNMLSWLGIAPDPREMAVHFNFCIEAVSPKISFAETESWAHRLLAANKRAGAFHVRHFEKAVIQHFFVIAVKTMLSKRAARGEIMRSRLMKKALSPAYCTAYLKRYLFSRRLNRLL